MSNYNSTSESLSEFLTFWRYINSQYQVSKEALESYNIATNDLLHQIELGKYDDRNKFATQLAKVRQSRRAHKDFIDVNAELYTLLNTKEYVKMYRTLEQLLGTIRKQERYVEGHRTYNPKILTNLTIETGVKPNE